MRTTIIIVLTLMWIVFRTPAFLADPSAPWILKAATYHFFHANIFHLAVNSLAIWSLFNPKHLIGVRNFFTAYIIATLMYCTAVRPVIGVSNILFATFGLRTPAFGNPWWKKKEVLVFFALNILMLLIPSISAISHITSLTLGILVAECRRKLNLLGDDYRRANR
ncbi:MAG: rhomboid family intramembrane serine protease [Prevotella sp.]|nr:rhomboid family intramembrane serine protease [Prevotella sp.]